MHLSCIMSIIMIDVHMYTRYTNSELTNVYKPDFLSLGDKVKSELDILHLLGMYLWLLVVPSNLLLREDLHICMYVKYKIIHFTHECSRFSSFELT